MVGSLFCPDCGMLRKDCVCGEYSNKRMDKAKKILSLESVEFDKLLFKPIDEVIIKKYVPLQDKEKVKNKNLKKDLEKPKKEKKEKFKDNTKPKKDTEKPKNIPNEPLKLGESDGVYSIENNHLPLKQIEYLKKQNPEIDEEIVENFLFENPRPGQLEIIEELYNAIENGYKYIILEAGTGTGKSVIASTLARIIGSAYILTRTKQLQKQYNEEFKFPLVKGRNNFDCVNEDLITTCDMGTCRTSTLKDNFICPYGLTTSQAFGSVEAFKKEDKQLFLRSDNPCHYWKQKAVGINSPISIMNYDYSILEFNHVQHFKKRKLLVLDEAHNVEDILMSTLEVKIENFQLENDIHRKLSHETLKNKDYDKWIIEIKSIIESYQKIKTRNLAKNHADKIKDVINELTDLVKYLENEPENWIIDNQKDSVSFKPLRVSSIAEKYLFKYGEVVLFMSATILDKKLFSKWLGLKPEEVYYLSVPTPFDSKKRPIELDFAGKMNRNRMRKTLPKTLPIISEILKKHENEKGMIHTHSYDNQKYIKRNLPNSRLLTHNRKNRTKILKKFEKASKPLVLVSPSMNEGVDLPYDKCRFQIIYKIPYPNLTDKQVYKRMRKEGRWYDYQTAIKLMQTYGRGMRAEDDSCVTYIIDEDFKTIYNRPIYRKLIQQSFKDAIINPNLLELKK